tara:strand:+ start:242 stop:376 length:135 start_codon:yes stop_codon:yes gene_type:complete
MVLILFLVQSGILKKILDELEISFISPEGNKIIAKSNFNIYKNK